MPGLLAGVNARTIGASPLVRALQIFAGHRRWALPGHKGLHGNSGTTYVDEKSLALSAADHERAEGLVLTLYLSVVDYQDYPKARSRLRASEISAHARCG